MAFGCSWKGRGKKKTLKKKKRKKATRWCLMGKHHLLKNPLKWDESDNKKKGDKKRRM